ncbi:MAG: alpha/beta fold hydrolase [Gammaproteobacteria bacterium]|nr:MAG: alpha/beta fold hydrolase [Gammaproteobacteria bacterium]TLY84228.1 MAG: alpha/beta fold hydrolase [Gammaproteobacteria bacterium]
MQYVEDDFRPSRWLRNRHLQSMLASTAWRRGRILRGAAPLLAAQRELLLDCGAGVRLQCFLSSPAHGNGPAVVLLHGWEGSADSLYVLSLAQLLFAQRFAVARLNLRDHGDTHHLNRELFHSCRLPEVIGAVRALQQHLEGTALRLVGFSLGGNFMLRVAAQAREAGLDLAQVIAVSPVLDPAQTLTALERGLPGYERYFVRKWLRSLRRKQAAWPGSYDFRQLARRRGLRSMTAELVRSHSEFATLEDYLNGYALTGARLARLEVPALILTSLDDPIIPADGLARLARPAALSITVTRYGGHCGFFQRLTGPTWLERRILAELGAGRGAQPAPGAGAGLETS